MKKYNHMLVFSLLIYLILAIVVGNTFLGAEHKRNHAYRVEANRIMAALTDADAVNEIDVSTLEYVEGVEFLDKTIVNPEEVRDFFQEEDMRASYIQPFYIENQLEGYLKFLYQESTLNLKELLLVTEIALAMLEAFVFGVLIFLKKKLVDPFRDLSELPEELAKGHFKGPVKEEKNRYLGRFMWGMGQLKDALDISRGRQLELMREKKTMLLSLSHDIKTPLNLIKLYSKALEENIYTDEEQKRNASHQIGEKTKEIEKYVEEIMQSSREDLLDMQVNQGEFYLKDLLEKVLSVYNEQCILRHIELKVEGYENRLLKGDVERGQEILENLFENAFKYGDGCRIELDFYEEDHCQLIRIFNTGLPVTDQEFNHLFESFFRGSNAQGVKGSGLGLYICRELMHKMDGTVFAEMSEGGMAFVLVFQLA